MCRVAARWLPWTFGLLLLSGCLAPVRDRVEEQIGDLASHPWDPEPLALPPTSAPSAASDTQPQQPSSAPTTPAAPVNPAPPGQRTGRSTPGPAPVWDALQPVALEVPPRETAPPTEREELILKRLRIPPVIPGANVPSIRFPENVTEAEKKAIIRRFYPPLRELPPEHAPLPGPDGHPMTLTYLQQVAVQNSPLVRRDLAALQAAIGAARQAGAYPNPNVGYESDTAGTSGTAGYQGGFIEQIIKTGGKLKLAQAAALIDVRNAELTVRATQRDVAYQVRQGYFAVLVAEENVRLSRAVVTFADEMYGIVLDNLLEGQVAGYAPMQFRYLADQARVALFQAEQPYVSAWRQLAANLGLPRMPPTQLAGRADMPLPVFCYEKVRERVLNQHTDVLTATYTVQKDRYNLRLAEITPVPDVDVRVVVQKDFTAPPFQVVHSVQVGVPLPIWDQNLGAIQQAQGTLMHDIAAIQGARDDLSVRLADAFERYDDNRRILEDYRDRILPDLVRVYLGVALQFTAPNPGLSFIDISTAQQNLTMAVTTYLTALGALWTATVDIANLLETHDLFQLSAGECSPAVPDLQHLEDASSGGKMATTPGTGGQGQSPSPAGVGKDAKQPEFMLPMPRPASPGGTSTPLLPPQGLPEGEPEESQPRGMPLELPAVPLSRSGRGGGGL